MICPNLYMQPKKDHILTGPYSKFWCLVKWQIKKPVGKGHVAYLIGIINCIVWGYSNNAKRKKIKYFWFITKADDVFPHSSVGKESACSAGELGSIPGLGRYPGEGNGNPIQYSCLENPMDRGAWQATVHGVTRVRHDLVTKSPPPWHKN